MGDVYFLRVIGGGVSDEVAETLFRAAQKMVRKEKDRLEVSGPDFEGVVTTEFKHYSIGTLTGISFEAELDIDSASGEQKMTFLFDDMDHELTDEDEVRWIHGRHPGGQPTNRTYH